ncbi:hypothetical protein ES705_08236 [subsurface metagenome]
MQFAKLSKLGILALLFVTITVFSGCGGGGIVPSINHSPAITSIPNTTAFVEVAYTYDVDATDLDVADILTYSLTGSIPVGMTIDPTTGVINWTPTAVQIEDNNVTVEVSDNGSPVESDTQSFTIVVSSAGRISGIVISDAGGPAVEGSTVTVDDSTINTTTDAEGNYVIDKVPVGTHDIIVTQSGRATSKVQNVVVIKDQTTTVDFIQKKVNVPTWETEPPTISTTGIAEGTTLSGIVTCSVQVADALDIKYVFVGFDYVPTELENDFVSEDSNEITLDSIDTTYIPDGEFQIVIVAYDMNYNRSQLTLNVTIDNGGSGFVPATPAYLWPLSVTLGENVGFFSTGRSEEFNKIGTKEDPNIINLPEGKLIDLDSIIKVAGPDSNLFVEIIWDSVVDATGYKIYRKFEGEATYHCIGSTEYPEFIDTDPRLSIGKKTYYQISAFNAFGESDPTTAEWTTPLPKFNLNLVSPADGATSVSLTPTLQWAPVVAVGNYREYEFYVIGKNDSDYTWSGSVENETSVVYNGEPLQYLKVYEWNVDYAIAFDDDYGTFPEYRAVSIAGGGAGSLNGSFEFTTQSE